MCLNLFAYKAHPQYDLIIAANRDEFYKRPTAEAHHWEENPNIIAGKDLLHNGTWLGLNKNGRFAFITNHRDLSTIKQVAPSRGPLVSNFLFSDDTPQEYVNGIDGLEQYNGFNLVIGTINEAYYLSNVKGKPEPIEQGIHGVSNAFMDTPWQKVELGKNCLRSVIERENFSVNELFDMLRNEEQAPEDQLPETGLPLEMEKAVSSMFIKSPEYGTVCSTVVLINKTGEVYFEERITNPLKENKASVYRFTIES